MNRTTAPSATQASVIRPNGLTDESQVANREHKPTDEQIRAAFEKLLHLHSAAGEAVAQFAAVGAIRQVIFRPGSEIFAAYEWGAREVQGAVKPLGDRKASGLIDEILTLAHRMVRVETSLPPARPYHQDKNQPADNSTAAFSMAGAAGELNLAGIALYLGSGTLWNYLGSTLSRPDLQGKNLYVLSQSELMKWCKWNGSTDKNDIDEIIDKVTQHLGTLCV